MVGEDTNNPKTLIEMMEAAVNREVNDTCERFAFKNCMQKDGENSTNC